MNYLQWSQGPITPQDKYGNKYLVTFIDCKSNYVRVFAATHKNRSAAKFQDFVTWFETEFDCRVLRTDCGDEYDSVSIYLFGKQYVVKRQTIEAGTPQAIGMAKIMNRTISNMARYMIFETNIPLTYWNDAAVYAVFI